MNMLLEKINNLLLIIYLLFNFILTFYSAYLHSDFADLVFPDYSGTVDYVDTGSGVITDYLVELDRYFSFLASR